MTGSIRRTIVAVLVTGTALSGAAFAFGGGANAAGNRGTYLGTVRFDTSDLSPRGDISKAFRECGVYRGTTWVKLISLGHHTQDTGGYWDQKFECHTGR